MANDIAITLTSDTRNFSRGMRSAREELTLFRSTIDTVKGAVAGFLTFQAIKGGVGVLTDTIGKLDDLSAQADRLGVSTEFLSELQYAAKLSDTEVESLNGAFEKLEKNLGKNSIEGGDLTKMLNKVGLDSKKLMAAGPEEAFLQIADAASRISDPLQRAAFVTDVFGKSGQSLIGILSRGKAGINALREEARNLGISISGDAAEKIGLADDAMKRLGASTDAFKNILAIELAPLTTSVLDGMTASVGFLADQWRNAKDNLGEFVHLLGNARNFLPRFAGGISAQESINQFRRDRQAERDAQRIAREGNKTVRGDGIDLGGPDSKLKQDFKSFAKPLALESKEGFSALARALTQSSGNAIADKQLAEAKKHTTQLGRIEEGLRNQPKIAPAF